MYGGGGEGYGRRDLACYIVLGHAAGVRHPRIGVVLAAALQHDAREIGGEVVSGLLLGVFGPETLADAAETVVIVVVESGPCSTKIFPVAANLAFDEGSVCLKGGRRALVSFTLKQKNPKLICINWMDGRRRHTARPVASILDVRGITMPAREADVCYGICRCSHGWIDHGRTATQLDGQRKVRRLATIFLYTTSITLWLSYDGEQGTRHMTFLALRHERVL